MSPSPNAIRWRVAVSEQGLLVQTVAALACLWALGAVPASADGVALPSVKVELPWGDREFEGEESTAVNNVCLACHSAEMVLQQPKLSAAAWTAEVNKMRAVFKAPIEDADVPMIVDYLVKLQNPQ
jgi:hypothetical protein